MKSKMKVLLILTLLLMSFTLNPLTILAKGKIILEKNYSVSLNESLIVKASGADIEVKGWDKEEVDFQIVGDESIKEYYDFKFSYKNGDVTLISEKLNDWNIWSFSKEFKINISVPSKFKIDVKTSGGDIEAKFIVGLINLHTSGGDIGIKKSEGELEAITSGGDIEISNFSGNIILKTSGGDIEAKEIIGNTEAKTSGGDIELNVMNGKIIAGTSGGSIGLKYKGENRGVELYTSAGSIDVKLPNDFNADVTLKTSGGSIQNKFDKSRPIEISKTKFEGKFNGGGSEFVVKTSGGSIYVNDK